MSTYDIENEYGKAYKFNKESSFPLEKAEKFLVDSQDNESIYFDKGYHRFMGWTFLPKGYQKFLVKYAYSLGSRFDYMEIFAKDIERANILFAEKHEEKEIFAIIPEPDTFKNPLESPKESRFTSLDYYEEDHKKDLLEALENGNMECLVDEEQGGIIAYYLKGNQDLILTKMNI